MCQLRGVNVVECPSAMLTNSHASRHKLYVKIISGTKGSCSVFDGERDTKSLVTMTRG